MISAKFYNKEFILKLLSWSVLFFSIIAGYSNFTPHQLTMLFSSDSVFFPTLYNDVVNEGGRIQDWFLSASFVIFPDYIIYYLINKIFSPHFLTAAVIYAYVQVILIVILSVYIFKRTVPENLKKYSWLIPLLFSIFFIESFYFSNDILIATLLCNYSYHTGAFFSMLLVIAILLSSMRDPFKYILIYLVALLSTFSDLLFIVILIAPLFLVLLLTINRAKLVFNLIVIFCLIFGAYSGLKIVDYMREHNYTHFSESINIYDTSKIMPAFIIFKNQMLSYFSCQGFRMYHFIFTFLAIPVCLYLALFKRKWFSEKQMFILIFFFIFACGTLAAPIINGVYIGTDNIRYSIMVFYFSIILLAICIALLFEYKIKTELIRNISLFVLPGMFLLMVAAGFSKKGLSDYFSYYPSKVNEIDSVCKQYGLKNGISEYWVGKWATQFSKNNIKIRTVYSSLCSYPMGGNAAWYNYTDFDFVIADKLDSVAITSRFKIRDTVQTESYTILIVDKFQFLPGDAMPTTNKIK